jgi:hypothetical protein
LDPLQHESLVLHSDALEKLEILKQILGYWTCWTSLSHGFRLRLSVCLFVGDAAFGNQKVRVVEGTSHINRNRRHLASAIE